MKKILNYLFLVLKFILLIISFGLTFYIVLSMYSRIEKNIINSLPIFIPFLLTLVLFCINILFKQKTLNNNLFYNLTCCLVFMTICIVSIRAIFDKNMILNQIMGYNINFAYFNDFIGFMKIMLYGLIISNIIFILTITKNTNSNKKPIAKKIETL